MVASASNLTISIGADTTKLRADLAVAKSLYRDSLRDLNQEAKNFQQTQDRTRLDQAAARTEVYSKSVATLTGRIKEATNAHHDHGGAITENARRLAEFTREAGFAIEGTKALKLGFAAFAGAELIRGLVGAIDKINEFNKRSKETGASVGTLQTIEKLYAGVNLSAEKAAASAAKLSAQFRESGKGVLEAGGTLGGPQVVRGGATQPGVLRGGAGGGGITQIEQGAQVANVLRGGTQEAVKFDDALKLINVDRARFGEGAKEFDKYWVAIAKGVVNLQKLKGETAASIVTGQLLGATWEEVGKVLTQIAESGSIEKLGAQIGVKYISPEQQKEAEEYAKTIRELKDAFDEMARTVIDFAAPAIKWFFESFSEGLKIIMSAAKLFGALWNDIWKNAAAGIEKIKGALGLGGDGGTSAPTSHTSAPTDYGNAAGGFIRGPGSGTSDSIHARLSAGEYVINAASTRRLGVGFLHSLNGFAAGGLVGPMRFAAGGLVGASSGSGRPVHLHLGGQAFALAGSSSVVESLISHANGARMRSAGVTPSWYGSRSGGS